jgi:glutamate synthase domain-containing protein 2
MNQRTVFYLISIGALAGIVAVGYFFWPWLVWALIPWGLYVLIGLYDVTNRNHSVLRNYPVLGHLRYIFEFVRPEIQQYFVSTDLSGRPFSREQRTVVYSRAKGQLETVPFGTQHDVTEAGYECAAHSLAPKKVPVEDARVLVGGPDCTQPYLASRLNISAMSFGALGENAILALNKGAKLGNFAHNTGEGGLSPHHLAGGGDIIWQIGTGYFSCRTPEGNFDSEKFRENANRDAVKMIEIKLSQGAKPSHGGILPAAKVDKEISKIRGVPMGQDVISPPAHSAFDGPTGLLHFVRHLRDLTGGKPIGFKLCIGVRSEFMGICKAMLSTGILPDFITIDGAEGGTGAAPPEFTNRLGTPINEGIVFVHSCLVGIGLRDKIRIIGSGKVISGFDMVTKIALGADMCNSARGMMFALGCIQSLRCNNNSCPTGVATQDAARGRALVVKSKFIRVRNFHDATVESFLEIAGAMGVAHPDQLTPRHIQRRVADETLRTYDEIYHFLAPGELMGDEIHPSYARDWAAANATSF